jgi:peptidoglycan/xylan/chitin deacetylase (PgdA/CDA1 family)
MAVTRGEFLKQFGKSLPGMILGSGIAAAAHKVLGKVAAVTGDAEAPAAKDAAPQPAQVEFIKSGPTTGNQIALTFDDGPTPGVTDLILDELKRHGAKATFFMIGEQISAAPSLARRVLAEGHEIGNHTFTHPNLTTLPAKQVETEIERTNDIIANVLQHRAVWFRPPFGALHQNQAPALTSRGLRVVLWSVDPGDWAQPGAEKITERILAETKPGSIIVCHDKFPQTLESVKVVLAILAERGLTFVTLSQLLADRDMLSGIEKPSPAA